MSAPLLLFFAALAVRHDQTPVRAGCDAGAEILTKLPAGTPVEIRFRLADGSDCFKISAAVDGKDITGYVSASALMGLERFERERSAARSADNIRAMHPVETETRKVLARTGDAALDRATKLLESNQPAQ